MASITEVFNSNVTLFPLGTVFSFANACCGERREAGVGFEGHGILGFVAFRLTDRSFFF